MNIDLTKILLAIITLLGTIVTGYVIPLLKSKLNAENAKLTQTQQTLLKTAIKAAVTAAEQLYKSEEGQLKKGYVLSILQSQGYDVDLAAVDAAIEATVKEVHESFSKN